MVDCGFWTVFFYTFHYYKRKSNFCLTVSIKLLSTKVLFARPGWWRHISNFSILFKKKYKALLMRDNAFYIWSMIYPKYMWNDFFLYDALATWSFVKRDPVTSLSNLRAYLQSLPWLFIIISHPHYKNPKFTEPSLFNGFGYTGPTPNPPLKECHSLLNSMAGS